MDIVVCHRCSKEIEDKGISFRGQVFCSDECCEEHENEIHTKGEPKLDDLSEDETTEDLDDMDLGYTNDDENPDEKDNLMDDDFDIRPEDF